jgi:outer membrane protein assembly factor BamB
MLAWKETAMALRSFAILFVTSAFATAGDWPGWRGPQGNGQTAEKNLPLTWSDKENVRWKISLPGEGNSSPVILGDRVFLSQSLDKPGHKRALWCLNRANGKMLWQREVEFEPKEPTHGTNSFCSATPLTDGERVIVSHGSAGLYCYDLKGNEQWKYDVGKLWHIWGNASSPIFYKNLVILWCGPGERQFLVALDKKTGTKVWQFDEPDGKSGMGESREWLGSWATPVVVTVGRRDELILPVPHKVKGIDPATGKELWFCDGMGPLVYGSPTVSADGIVVAFSGYGGPCLAVKAGGQGDVTKTRRLWHQKGKVPQSIGSPVILGDRCYFVDEPGTARCIDIKTGDDVGESQKIAKTWSSVIHADGKLYLATYDDGVFVLEASPKFTELAHNVLGKERMRATVSVADGALYIRTFQHLWCIGAKP